MSTTYTHGEATGTSRTTGIAAQTLNTLCHFAGSEIDNSVYLDLECDLVVLFTLAATAVAGDPIKFHVLYAMDGTNYEDGIPSTNDGTAAASPVPPPQSLVGVVAALADTAAHRIDLRGIPLLPYKFRIVPYNGTTRSITSLLTVLCYGRKYQTIGP